MSITAVTGPFISTGNTNPQQNSEPDAAPSIFADGTGVVDSRWAQTFGVASTNTRIVAVSAQQVLTSVDAFPQAKSTTNIVNASGATAVAGTKLTLAAGTVAATVAAVPVVPWVASTDQFGNKTYVPQAYNSTSTVTAGLTIDPGVVLGSTFTSTNVTLSANLGPSIGTYPAAYAGTTVPKSQVIVLQTTNHVQPEMCFSPGQPIIVAAAGNAGGTIPLLATILAIDYVNHYLYVSTPALAAQTNAAVFPANQFGVGAPSVPSGSPISAGIAYYPYNVTGACVMFDPRQGVARALQYVSSNAGDTTVTLTVAGYDVFGVPMTETITLNGTTIVLGKKAFKHIVSITTGVATLVGNVSVGTTDTLGLNYRTDAFSYLQVYNVDALVTANTGFTKADITPVATATTGDVRGTYTVQTTAPDGTKRVLINVLPSPYQWDLESNIVQQPIWGQTQF
jgi:hypothetical protein